MDVSSRIAFLDAVTGFAASGRTVVLTTHFMEEADQVAGRIVVIDRGRIIADGPPSQIKARAAGKRVRFRVVDAIDQEAFRGMPLTGLAVREGEVRFLTNQPEPILAELFVAARPSRTSRSAAPTSRRHSSP